VVRPGRARRGKVRQVSSGEAWRCLESRGVARHGTEKHGIFFQICLMLIGFISDNESMDKQSQLQRIGHLLRIRRNILAEFVARRAPKQILRHQLRVIKDAERQWLRAQA
jgi:hypothetical protein